MTLRDLRCWLVVSFVLLWLALFVIGMRAYHGSAVVYAGFSVVFLALLASAIYRQRTYVYSFLAIFLWLGFWNKLSWKLAGFIGLPEPTGQFVETADNWDEVLLVATVAAAAVLASRCIWALLGWRTTLTSRDALRAQPEGGCSSWECVANLNPWGSALFVVVAAALVWANVYYGIAMVGLEVRTVLPWPLNALISLMLMGGGGLTIWAGTMIWWQAAARRPVLFYLVIFIVCAVIVATGSLSRLVVVSYSLPLLYALYLNRQTIVDFSVARSVAVFFLFCLAVAGSFVVVGQLRSSVYFNDELEAPVSKKLQVESSVLSRAQSTAKQLLVFSIVRWVGIEGVMAVSAYHDKSPQLLVRGVLERPRDGETALYEKIAPFPEVAQLMPGVALSSIPGGVGFLYYSGSMLLVFFLALSLSLSLQAIEVVIYRLTANPLLCASAGFLMSMLFAHQWGMPYYVIPFMGFVMLFVVLVAAMQSWCSLGCFNGCNRRKKVW